MNCRYAIASRNRTVYIGRLSPLPALT